MAAGPWSGILPPVSIPSHVSATLDRLVEEHPEPNLTVGQLLLSLEGRAIPLLILFLALPNIVGVGTIPGVSTLFGLPQMILAMQLVVGRRQPWLPKRALSVSLTKGELRRILDKARPWLSRVERRLRPRFTALTTPGAERALGVLLLILATVVALPIPGANNLPSVAMAVISLGLLAFDGIFVMGGVVIGLVSLVVATAVIGAAWYAAEVVFTRLFG